MLAILAPIVVFGLVIFVHELGHFLAAKSVGVYAPRFSIGFGPALWRRRRGETEYILAAIPLGGYVRMASRHDEATAFLEGGSEEKAKKPTDAPDFDPNAMIPFGPKPVPEHRWFESKPLWARLYILVAGVTMNFLLGLIVAIGLAMHFGRPVITTRVVGYVRPVGGQPLLSAIQPGDTLLRVNGREVRSWTDAEREMLRSVGQLTIETNRANVTIPLDQPGSPTSRDIALALDFEVAPVIGHVIGGEPARRAGFQPGDSVVAIDGTPVKSWTQMVIIVANSAERPIRVEVVRKGESARRTLTVTPKLTDAPHPVTGQRAKVGKIGAAVADISAREPVSFSEAIVGGARMTWFMSTAIIGTVRDLITRQISSDQLGGLIAITQASVQAARSGLENFLGLLAFISVNVAVFNLLPIPILDGGQILINVIESVRRKPLSLRTREYMLRFALVLILLLVALATYNDIRRLVRDVFG
jgi:regulator of sigma E protease